MATETAPSRERRLTSFSHGAGCGCKLGPDDLLSVLGELTLPEMPADLVVAADTGDDAAVYRLPSGEGLIATLDFFTPIVDDPYDWGRIAATNALSDVYAMGGRAFLALNIVNWPVDDLPLEMLGRVLQGGIDVAAKTRTTTRAARASGRYRGGITAGTTSSTRYRTTSIASNTAATTMISRRS